MLSRTASDAAGALRLMAGDLRVTAQDAGAIVTRIGTTIDGLAQSWVGPTPTEFSGLARLASTTLAPWPSALDAAGATLERWAGRADDIAADARRAERRLAEALDAEPTERDVMVRSARSGIDEVAQRWANTCRQCRFELSGSINALTRIGDEPWGIGTGRDQATEIAVMVGALDLDLERVDSTGGIQAVITAVLDNVVSSPVAPLVFTILETARDRDVFTTDGDLSDDDLAAAIDPTWAREAIDVWQRATGITIDETAADAIAGLIPTVASLMRADRDRDWSEEDGTFEFEPSLGAVLADAAVASFTRSPNVLAAGPGVFADAVEAFTSAGAGDLDVLRRNPTSSEWSYHLHGPPSIGEQFETSVVFRTLVFDWQQVWGEDRSWVGGGIEVATGLPISKAGKVGRLFDRADDTLDLTRVPGGRLVAHESAGGHTIEKHVGRSVEQMRHRMAHEGREAVSSFSDLETAERAVTLALTEHTDSIATWLASGTKVKLLTTEAGEPLGTVVRAVRSGPQSGSTVRVVLIRDDAMEVGFHIKTAYLE